MRKLKPLTARAVNVAIGRVDALAVLRPTRIRGWHEWTSGMHAMAHDGRIVVRRFYCGLAVALSERDREQLAGAGLALDIATGVVTRSEAPTEASE